MSPPASSVPLAWIAGVGLTPYGKLPGMGAVELQARAAREAIYDAGVGLKNVDGVITGYATTLQHLMPADLLAEHLGVRPAVAFGTNVGGATGLIMLTQAVALIGSGAARCVLVAAGEDRATGRGRDTTLGVLAQIGHQKYEVPVGGTIPAYYALVASSYLQRYGLDPWELAPLAVQMRANASRHPGAQFTTPITVDDVTASRPVAEPLRLLDCCPVSDGGSAFVVTADRTDRRSIAVTGTGQAHRHQHVTEADMDDLGARRSANAALAQAGARIEDVDIFGVYDSFTVTLAILLEELGLAEPGDAGRAAARGELAPEGRAPLNTHGGLLSYGHPGVAGGMAHLAEVVIQLRGEAGDRQIAGAPGLGLVHADGGVLSAHVTTVLATPGVAQ